MEVSFNICDVNPFMAMCDLRDWNCCDEKQSVIYEIGRFVMRNFMVM